MCRLLSRELIEGLAVKSRWSRYLDATVGGGGHDQQFWKLHRMCGQLTLTRDEQAITAAKNQRPNNTSIFDNFAD